MDAKKEEMCSSVCRTHQQMRSPLPSTRTFLLCSRRPLTSSARRRFRSILKNLFKTARHSYQRKQENIFKTAIGTNESRTPLKLKDASTGLSQYVFKVFQGLIYTHDRWLIDIGKYYSIKLQLYLWTSIFIFRIIRVFMWSVSCIMFSEKWIYLSELSIIV